MAICSVVDGCGSGSSVKGISAIGCGAEGSGSVAGSGAGSRAMALGAGGGGVNGSGADSPAGDARRLHGRVLIVSSVWPEHGSSAAGVRTRGIIDALLGDGCSVGYMCIADAENEYRRELSSLGVATYCVPLNREADAVRALREFGPQVCVFDRFTSEEAFSFRVRAEFPDCLLVLDTQDLHFLRGARQAAWKRGCGVAEIMAVLPDASDVGLQRELASIHRCDLAVVCSAAEEQLLLTEYKICREKVVLSSFFYDAAPPLHNLPPYAERAHFVTIGIFKHAPNMDSYRWLAKELWPAIRSRLPDAELHIYGAHATSHDMQMHAPSKGLHMKGRAESLQVLGSYRVLLAPLRFGAGIKGKVLDAWRHGTPVVTTPIGAEGIHESPLPLTQLTPDRLAAMRKNGGQSYVSDAPGGGRDVGGIFRTAGENSSSSGSVEDIRPATDSIAGSGGRSQHDSSGAGGGCEWGGLATATTAEEFVQDAVELYTNERLWRASQSRGAALLPLLFGKSSNAQALLAALSTARDELHRRRACDYTQAVLWYQGNRATEFFSRWIELKEAKLAAEAAHDGTPGPPN